MVSVVSHGIEAQYTIYHAMKKPCLAMQNNANQCRMKTQKSPQLRGLRCVLALLGAS